MSMRQCALIDARGGFKREMRKLCILLMKIHTPRTNTPYDDDAWHTCTHTNGQHTHTNQCRYYKEQKSNSTLKSCWAKIHSRSAQSWAYLHIGFVVKCYVHICISIKCVYGFSPSCILSVLYMICPMRTYFICTARIISPAEFVLFEIGSDLVCHLFSEFTGI